MKVNECISVYVYIQVQGIRSKLLLINTSVTEVSVPQLAIHMQKSFYSVSEADGSVEVCAEVTTQQFEGIVQVNYTTAGGSAEGLLLTAPSTCFDVIMLSVHTSSFNFCRR